MLVPVDPKLSFYPADRAEVTVAANSVAAKRFPLRRAHSPDIQTEESLRIRIQAGSRHREHRALGA